LLNNHREKYITFYNTYSKFLKVGLYNDSKLKLRLQDLILFKHINNPYEYISLKSYSDNLDNLKLKNTTVNDTTTDNTTTDNTTTDNTTTENTTTNNTTTENTTTENTTTDNTTTDNTTTENTTTDNTTTDNTTTDNTTVKKEKTQEERDREQIEEYKYKLIYYIYGDNLEYLLNSPNLIYAKNKGHDVLLMNDPVDEYLF